MEKGVCEWVTMKGEGNAREDEREREADEELDVKGEENVD